VLHDIDFEAKPGEVIALVGLTGAGKTTLVSLIPRFYDTTAGSVTIDGVDVRRYRVRSLREKISIVLQDPVLFQGTIADNIRYGRLDATAQQIEKLANALGVPETGRELSAYARSIIDPILAKIAAVPKDKRPTVYYARGPQGLTTGLAGSINVEMIEFLGATNVAGQDRGGLANVGLEQVVLWDPEVIVTNDPNFYRDVWKLRVWSSVAAVRSKRVYLSPHLPFGWFDYPPGANRLIGLEWLAQILYPQLFRFDLKRDTAEFYRRFYHQEPTAAQLDTLLAEPGVAPR